MVFRFINQLYFIYPEKQTVRILFNYEHYGIESFTLYIRPLKLFEKNVENESLIIRKYETQYD